MNARTSATTAPSACVCNMTASPFPSSNWSRAATLTGGSSPGLGRPAGASLRTSAFLVSLERLLRACGPAPPVPLRNPRTLSFVRRQTEHRERALDQLSRRVPRSRRRSVPSSPYRARDQPPIWGVCAFRTGREIARVQPEASAEASRGRALRWIPTDVVRRAVSELDAGGGYSLSHGSPPTGAPQARVRVRPPSAKTRARAGRKRPHPAAQH
jgi:hypothetical protein